MSSWMRWIDWWCVVRGPGPWEGRWVRRSPVVSVGGNKKAAAPVWNCGPGTSSVVPRPVVRLRVTSDPILRTAGPPAHTHVPGDLGVGHGPRMVAHVGANRQPSDVQSQRSLGSRPATGRRLAAMSAIPATFRAYVAEKVDDRVERGVRDFARGRPAARRGRDPGRLVERQLQGRPGDAGRRQGRPDQPAHPGHRPGRRGHRQRRPGDRGRRGRSWPTATSWASRATAGTPSTSACRPAGSCRSRRA